MTVKAGAVLNTSSCADLSHLRVSSLHPLTGQQNLLWILKPIEKYLQHGWKLWGFESQDVTEGRCLFMYKIKVYCFVLWSVSHFCAM